MLNNFIGGGQVFLHKMRMLKQVVSTTIFVSLITGVLLAWSLSSDNTQKVDLDGAITYASAKVALALHPTLSVISIGKTVANVDAYSNGHLWKKKMPAISVLKSHRFKSAWNNIINIMQSLALKALGFGASAGFLVFLFWSRFGKDLQNDKRKEGSGVILSSKEVYRKLRIIKKCSDLYIGDMPLVKDMETKHFLITGSTGSGKTNLLHTLLPQIERKGQPVIIVDQTGEMIAKYYRPERGDIIFNPFDARGKAWDFFADCNKPRYLEKFADALIGFNARKNNKGTLDFWEESAQSIFVAVAEVMQESNNYSIEALYKLICLSENNDLYRILKGKDAAKHFNKDNTRTVASIMSVLMTNIKPLRFLRDKDKNDNGSFALQEYVASLDLGASNWLFLSTEPSTRELTIPLNAALIEILTSHLMTRHNTDNKTWVVIDELASLGMLPSMQKLMQEGRKYNICVVAATQSTSQLYHYYGDADASNLIGLFKTKFIFGSDDPKMGELYSKLCGSTTVTMQQKNTSFGANEFRDGVSYNEKREHRPLVSYEDFTRLKTGECFTLLPEPLVRLSRMQVPMVRLQDKNPRFIEAEQTQRNLGQINTLLSTREEVSATPISTDQQDLVEIQNDEERLNHERQEVDNPSQQDAEATSLQTTEGYDKQGKFDFGL